MNKKEKTERMALVDKRLEQMYPNAPCALDYRGDGWKLLVMGRLSAQCTDARVNTVSLELFSRYKTAAELAAADIKEVEEIIKPCGLYRMKAKNIIEASRQLAEDFGGEVPKTMDELLTIDGVGRKIANLLLGDLYSLPCVVCDTHCIRICGRLGMYPQKEKNPEKIEKILSGIIDMSRGSDFCHRIVAFGREICTARNPKCAECQISNLCEKYAKQGGV